MEESPDQAKVQFITLKETFYTGEITSKELYIRECTRDIYDSLKEVRNSAPDGETYVTAAVIGQPGIGKSCFLYYFALRFLQENDVDIVMILNDIRCNICIYQFSSDREKILGSFHNKPKDATFTEMQAMLDEHGNKAILLVDMNQKVDPTVRLTHDKGLTVFTSSPGPYKKWLSPHDHRLNLNLYSPPPLSKEETKSIYDRIKTSFEPELLFEDYFDVFGGTIRPIRKPKKEFLKMKKGSSKLLESDPATILDMVKKGPKEEGEDFTHALFKDLGGKKEDSYKVEDLSSIRDFRSDFAAFWFQKCVAPRILFQAYNASVLNVLYKANKLANGGARGCDFEDLFHKLLPLGNWKTEALPEHQENYVGRFVHGVLGSFGFCPPIKSDAKDLTLLNVPVVQRGEDETAEADLHEQWNKAFGKKKDGKDSTTTEGQKEDNRRDVAKLITACQEKEEFYWLPRGPHFPGVDSVHKNASSLNFFQVQTGAVAEEVSKWIDRAFHFSKLLFDLMPIENKDQLDVSIIIGTEPARKLVLKKRKLETLAMPKNWSLSYVSAPVADETPELHLSLERYQNELKAEFLMFKARKQLLEQSATNAPQVAQ